MSSLNKKLISDTFFIRERIDNNKRVVAVNGCFDILHAGHVYFLEAAKKLGDVLIVGVNIDSSIKLLKGDSRPINPFHHRVMVLAGLECVDFVCGFSGKNAVDFLYFARPDVYAKSDSSGSNEDEFATVRLFGGIIVSIRSTFDISTTKIIEKIRSND